MNVSAAIAEAEVRIQCGILSSRHDHAKGARPRKRGGDAPGRSWHGVQAGGLAAQSVNILFQVCLSPSRLRAPVSLGDSAISRRTVMNSAGWRSRIAPPGSDLVPVSYRKQNLSSVETDRLPRDRQGK